MGRVVVFEYEYVVFSKSDGQLDTARREANESQFYAMNPDIVLWIWQRWIQIQSYSLLLKKMAHRLSGKLYLLPDAEHNLKWSFVTLLLLLS